MDKIQGSYGWTDEEVLNTRLSRIVQIKEAITQREELQSWESLKVTELQTKHLSYMISNTLDNAEARKELLKIADGFSLTGSHKEKKKPTAPKTYKLVTGETIDASELKNYTYDEVDHTEEDKQRIAAVIQENKGKSLFNLGGFTRG